jgi:prepilin-type N-terminal cleavage/methylation domain-containing protein
MIAKRALRGYTIVELMMAISVMAIGVTGIIAMQKVTLTANQHAKNLAVATQIGGAWLDALAADALQWNSPGTRSASTDIGDTRWLNNVNGAWFRPAYAATMGFGPAFDGLGNPVDEAAVTAGQAVYCTHLRLTWLFPETGTANGRPVTGNGLIRAEVRVFWQRDGGPGSGAVPCVANAVVNNISSAIDTYYFVYQTGAIRQNTL